jgi:S-adenosylmethionine:tRNA ribosyltransferase-isomerase
VYTIEDYDYDLPGDLIAQYPLDKRDQSRLLHLNRDTGEMSHRRFRDIETLACAGDVLVVNNTEVVPARLLGKKETGGNAEILIIDYAEGLSSLSLTGHFECRCLINASKRTRPGSSICLDLGMAATVVDYNDGIFRVRFSKDPEFISKLFKIGHIPLPPYVKRNDPSNEFDDVKSYQTVYASQKGAVAAPTAGLHFSDRLLKRLNARGVRIAEITLHVGYGTFLPVRVSDIREHKIHSERFSISGETAGAINDAKRAGAKVIAVGTTSVRTLEYASDDKGMVRAGEGQCDLFIYPGYVFKVVDAMITNYHLPKSTLLMLVCAFAGKEKIMAAYREAIKRKYRFYSYGDAMFIA